MQSSLGTMSPHHLFNWREYIGRSPQRTVDAFLTVSEAVVARWIQGPRGLMLLPMVPGNPASGAIYVFDRERGDWYMLCFDDGLDDQFTPERFDETFAEYDLFRYIDQPGLLSEKAHLGDA
jgi:hypothetical protein